MYLAVVESREGQGEEKEDKKKKEQSENNKCYQFFLDNYKESQASSFALKNFAELNRVNRHFRTPQLDYEKLKMDSFEVATDRYATEMFQTLTILIFQNKNKN